MLVLLIGVAIGLLVGLVLGYTKKKEKVEIDDIQEIKAVKNDEKLPPLPSKVPRHLAVIMDGNRRFGTKAYGDPLKGHWAGGQTLVDFSQWCMSDGIKELTVYAFSSENWNRDAHEVDTLMAVFTQYAPKLLKEALARDIKVNILSTGTYLANNQIHK